MFFFLRALEYLTTSALLFLCQSLVPCPSAPLGLLKAAWADTIGNTPDDVVETNVRFGAHPTKTDNRQGWNQRSGNASRLRWALLQWPYRSTVWTSLRHSWSDSHRHSKRLDRTLTHSCQASTAPRLNGQVSSLEVLTSDHRVTNS